METEKVKNSDVVIVGGGICGLATALALHRKGVSSVVLERSKELRATGAAIIIRHNGWLALHHLGVASKLRATAIPLRSVQLLFLDAGKKADMPIGNAEFRVLRRRDLIGALAEDLPPNTVRFGCNVVSIATDPISSFPVLQLQDGSFLNPKVVIGCDGVNSRIAKMVDPLLVSTGSFSTWVVRGFTEYENGHHLGDQFCFLDKPSHNLFMGHFPVTDKLVYWFLTKKSTPQDAMVSQNPELIKESAMEAIKSFPQQSKEMVEKSDVSSLHLTDLRYRTMWSLLRSRFQRGTVTVGGDAMHAMGPFIAQGGCASLEDAVVLARCLAAQMSWSRSRIEAALRQYVKERKMRVMRLCLQSFLVGVIRDSTSKTVRYIASALSAICFTNPDAPTYFDCGPL